ncbi:wd40 protein, putative [Talaromyces stipitatus ATCC 10500]|uniref:Wd40 protein, putative n=1 Tax=Talaromyces stipitatus (strain ATCC 10500 / CBS 375.48 / QM 6759 / NRRL 1006) TaxID=441959 RepID=B8M462_TALSN|nr:wd40 protein, putative [Talaromyces stipitatus ATCC 10500]EED20805.1 wd40 protein, putative [Talaromyces stipitatus ATCC 10500]
MGLIGVILEVVAAINTLSVTPLSSYTQNFKHVNPLFYWTDVYYKKFDSEKNIYQERRPGAQSNKLLKATRLSVDSVAFPPDGRLLESGSRDKTVKPWDTATGTLQQTLGGHLGLVLLVVFSPNGRVLASSSKHETVRLWDTATGNFGEAIANSKFPQDSPYLGTNFGTSRLG